MAQGWLEPNTRIPFIGIIAIVLIVAVVAVFVKTQMAPLFPQSTVYVEQEDNNQAGSASASFFGLREISVTKKIYLKGTLNTRERGLSFTIDPGQQLLIITEQGYRQEILLKQTNDIFAATFDYQGVSTRIIVDVPQRQITFSEPGKTITPIIVKLGELEVLKGFFSVHGRQYTLEVYPQSSSMIISGTYIDRVTLEQQRSKLVGTWQEGTKKHPVTVDLEKKLVTIEDIF